MTIIENYVHVIKNYAVFEGRATRSEYWYFVLANVLISFILGFIEGFTGIFPDGKNSVLSDIYSLAVLLPSIAVTIRRMHDVDHKGWWMLVPLYNLYLSIIKGTDGPNRFGDDKLQPAPVATAVAASEVSQNDTAL
jgi:uncharacterized membrane protein YhaH (DUF805 family)